MRSLAKSDLNDPSIPVAVPPGATALTRIRAARRGRLHSWSFPQWHAWKCRRRYPPHYRVRNLTDTQTRVRTQVLDRQHCPRHDRDKNSPSHGHERAEHELLRCLRRSEFLKPT